MVERPSRFLPFLAFACVCGVWAQSANSDALKLLDDVSKHYADADSYHIEAIRETRSSSELRSSWQKEILRAEEAPGNRYRFEGRSFRDSGIVVSDGVTEWNLHRTDDQYTKRSPGTFGHPFPKTPLGQDEKSEQDAFFLRRDLAAAGDFAKSAHFLPEETISIGDHSIECLVVSFGPGDLRRPFPSASTTQTFWIDKKHNTIVKSLRLSDSTLLYNSPHPPTHPVPVHSEDLTIYPVVELGAPIPSADFAFSPPGNGSLAEEFPPPSFSAAAGSASVSPKLPDMIGKMEPALTLHAADNSSLQLSSLVGHPVLIDLWATWCAPCLEEMPLIDHIFRKTKGVDLVVLGVDYDRDPKTAVDFLQRKNYGWADYHADSSEPGFPHNGIPLLVLINSEGRIVYYYNAADDEPGLLSAVKKLGPAFAAALNDDVKQ